MPVNERADHIVPVFYGVKLDRNDPHLEFNLARLENRFQKRYWDSIRKNEERINSCQTPHATTIQSIADNERRTKLVKVLRSLLLN